MRNNIIISVILVSILTIIISTAILLKEFISYREAKSSNDNLIEMVVNPKNNIDIEETDITKNTIDWKKLNEINKDIIGWIEFKNTNINYPILKDNNNLYYLKHTFEKKYNKNGSIFTINERPFEDNETVIYGHNMKNNIMFSELKNYLEEDYFLNHQNFIIYTPNINYQATIFSCYTISENIEDDNTKSLNFEELIQYYQKQSRFHNSTKEIKKIVKLSTCSYANNLTVSTNQRLFIIAKIDEIN